MNDEKLKKVLAVVGFGAATAGAAFVAAMARPDRWVASLRKPWFQPPRWRCSRPCGPASTG